MIVCTTENAGVTINVPTGYTLVTQVIQSSGDYGVAMFYKIKTSSAAENPTISTATGTNGTCFLGLFQ